MAPPSRRAFRDRPWGATAGLVHIEAPTAKAFSAELRTARRDLDKELRRSNREVGRQVRGWMRAEAAAGTRMQRRSAVGIQSVATARHVAIRVRPTARAPMANVAFFGHKQRFGWYARARYNASRGKQGPEWVGATWRVAQRGEGPEVINEVLADRQDDIGRMYLEGQFSAVTRMRAPKTPTTT